MVPYFVVQLNTPKLIPYTPINCDLAHDPAPQHDFPLGSLAHLAGVGPQAALHDIEHAALINFIHYLKR